MLSFIAFLLMLLGMVLALVILVLGVVNMAMGGELNYRWNNILMRYRLLSQFFAIAMFVVGFLLARFY
ncbi:MAG: HIG1 domain-containing protein [Alphaproteobacteria bacterium]|nr:HIG1 domain-containing protein [Alphaproteobacteria bacterium]